MLATLPTTLKPTIDLVKSMAADMGKPVSVIDGLAGGAYQAIMEGNLEAHDDLILKAATRLAETVDVIVLAQGSMARMEKDLKKTTGISILSSPYLCVQEIKSMLR